MSFNLMLPSSSHFSSLTSLSQSASLSLTSDLQPLKYTPLNGYCHGIYSLQSVPEVCRNEIFSFTATRAFCLSYDPPHILGEEFHIIFFFSGLLEVHREAKPLQTSKGPTLMNKTQHMNNVGYME